MKVNVCIYEHRHGVDVSVHRDRADAVVAGAAIARQWWGEAREIEPTLPEVPPDDDEAAMRLYFAACDGFELFEIRPREVLGAGRWARLVAVVRALFAPGRSRTEAGGSG